MNSIRWMIVACLVFVTHTSTLSFGQSLPTIEPAYQIVLRSRHAEGSPHFLKGSQTASGSVDVNQPEPNTIVIRMTGSAAASSIGGGSHASIRFDLCQDFDIVPTRTDVRPPRIGLMGRVVGTLASTNKGCGKNECSSIATQGPATAWINDSTGEPLLNVDVETTGVTTGGYKAINHRCGPVESVVTTGSYKLTSDFSIVSKQEGSLLFNNFTVADFTPNPQFGPLWREAMRTFQAVPKQDFGFTLYLRVVEDADALIATAATPTIH
jgi:hypothetical protein